jgi:hypothetical protein
MQRTMSRLDPLRYSSHFGIGVAASAQIRHVMTPRMLQITQMNVPHFTQG